MANFSLEKLAIRVDIWKTKLEQSLAAFYKEKADVLDRLAEIDTQIQRHKGAIETVSDFVKTMLDIRKNDEREHEVRRLEKEKREKDAAERRKKK